MRRFKLFLLQLKSAFVSYIKGLLIIVALFVVLAIVALGAWRIKSSATQDKSLLIAAIVAEDNSYAMDYLTDMIQGIQGVSYICDMKSMEWEEAYQGLEKGTVDVIIRIPAEFYDKAVHMEESEIEIYTWGQPTKLQKKLLAQLSGAQSLMNVTECKIYACYDGINTMEVPYSRAQIESDLFLSAVSGFMNRDQYFQIKDLSSFGSYTFLQFYSVTALILAMIIAYIPAFGMYMHGEKQLERLVHRSRMGFVMASLGRIVAMTIAAGSISTIVLLLLKSSFRVVGYLWIVSLSLGIWVHLLAALCGDSAHGRAIYVLISLIMLVSAGVLVPAVYLPGVIRDLSTYVPARAWHDMLMSAIYGKRRILGVSYVLISDVIVAIASIWVYTRSLVNHD